MPLNDQIRFRFAFETMRADKDECIVSLRLPAGEFAKAAMLPVMGEIVFEAVCTPVDVISKEGSV